MVVLKILNFSRQLNTNKFEYVCVNISCLYDVSLTKRNISTLNIAVLFVAEV